MVTKRNKLRLSAVLSAVALVGAILLAVLNNAYVPGEIAIIRAVYALEGWLWVPMLVITQLGSPWLIFGVVLALAWVHQYRLGLRLLLAGGVTYVLVTVLKLAIMRPRPFLTVSDIVSRELSISGNGFPSGHSALIALLVWSLWFYTGDKTRLAMVVVLIMVGISRIYLGVHSPLDVMGGYALGILVASLQQMHTTLFKGVRSS